jgi:hypothetical protein
MMVVSSKRMARVPSISAFSLLLYFLLSVYSGWIDKKEGRNGRK